MSKIISFLVNQIDQQKVVASVSKNNLFSFPPCLHQLPKRFIAVRGGAIPKTTDKPR
jgi:hypothetical protein